MSERIKMISEYVNQDYGVAELSRRYGVSRQKVYKWIERYEENGWEGLKDLSRAPHEQGQATPEAVEGAILELKRRWMNFGAPKIRHKLMALVGKQKCPAESTVSAILKRHGLVKTPRRRNRAVPSSGGTQAESRTPNEVWCADFKGWWKTRDGRRCEPLTVSDAWSRYLFKCVGLREGTRTELVKPHFEQLFWEYGLPEVIHTDNGAPFASTGLGGLTALSVWWLKLGIRLERSKPGCPQDNGRHERIHLTLEQSQERAAAANLNRQQEALEKFRNEYNNERPHESLGDRTPAQVYYPSQRDYTGRLPKAREYPSEWLTRSVRTGRMKWRGQEINVNQALAGERIGLEPCGDGRWAVWFEDLELGIFDERKKRIERHKTISGGQRADRV